MADITWPSTLPAPLTTGYTEEAPSGTIRTQMDAGPAKLRRRYTAAPRPFSLSYRMTLAQVATLDTFYVTTARAGTLRFNWTNPRTGAACEARFLSPPQYTGVEQDADVSVGIEAMP